MKVKSQREAIISDIKNIRTEYQILNYIKENCPDEMVFDPEFRKEVMEANRLAERAFIFVDMERKNESLEDLKDSVKSPEDLDALIEILGIEDVARKYRKEVFELAKLHQENEEFELAKKYYDAITDNGRTRIEKFNKKYSKDNSDDKDSIYYKSLIGGLLCKASLGYELTDDEKEKLEKTLKDASSKEESSIDKFLVYFSKLPLVEKNVEELLERIKQSTVVARRTRQVTKEDEKTEEENPKLQKQYIEELSPLNRLKFIMENFDIKQVYVGIGGFMGYAIFDVDDKDVLICEKFYDLGKNELEEPKPAYGDAAYIISKDADFTINSMDRDKIIQEIKANNKTGGTKKIKDLRHTSEKYYDRLIEWTDKLSKLKDSGELEQPEETVAKQAAEDDKAINGGANIQDEPSKEPSIFEMIQKLKELDQEFVEISEMIASAKEHRKKEEELKSRVNSIMHDIKSNLSQNITDEIIETIKQLDNELKSTRGLLAELENKEEVLSAEEIRQLEEKQRINREQREEINKKIIEQMGDN